MNINATIIVQAFNFLIVYWLLRRFLFSPTVAIINQESAQKGLLITAIDQQKKSLEIQEKERQHHWHICREYFSLQRPIVGTMNISLENKVIADYAFPVLSDESITELTVQISKVLEEKIKNVH